MATEQAAAVLRHIDKLMAEEKCRQVSDRDLLLRFTKHGDKAAFAAIVHRHGPMVRRMCERSLRRTQDAEDAFQATFLVLLRRAADLRWRASVAGWLHEVAYRLTLQMRTDEIRRLTHENQAAAHVAGDPGNDISVREAQAILHEELHRLPERLRAPLVLCYLESATQDEAARQLGWSLRTLKRRMERGRELLHVRLSRRGLTLSAVLSTGLLAASTTSGALGQVTIKAAVTFSMGKPAEVMSPSVAALVQGSLRALLLAKLKMTAALVLLVSLLGTALVLSRGQALPPADVKQAEKAIKQAGQEGQSKPDIQRKPLLDLHGDPLPPGAIARLGTSRFRNGMFKPCFFPDGKTLMTASRHSLQFWQTGTGRLLREIPTGSLYVHRIDLSPDCKLAAVSGTVPAVPSFRSVIRVWDVSTGKVVRTFSGKDRIRGHEELVFTPDSKLVVSIADGLVLFEEIASGKEVLRRQFPTDVLPNLAISPNGETLAVASGPNRRKLYLWNWKVGEKPREIKVPGDRIYAFCFSPDNKLLAGCADREDSIHLWDVRAGQILRTVAMKGKNIFGGHLAFSPNGKVLARTDFGNANNFCGGLFLWDLERDRYFHELLTPGEQVMWASFSPDSRWVAATTSGGVRVWDLRTGRGVADIEAAHRGWLTQIEVSVHGLVATASNDHTVRIWDAASGRQKMKLDHDYSVGVIALSPDGTKLVTSTDADNTVRVWDLHNGKEIKRLAGMKRFATGRALCLTPDGQRVVSWADNRSLRIWELKTGAVVEHTVPPGAKKTDQRSRDVERELLFMQMGPECLTPNGRYLLLRFHDEIKVYETASGKEWGAIPVKGGACAFFGRFPRQPILPCEHHGNRKRGEESRRLPGRIGVRENEKSLVSAWQCSRAGCLFRRRQFHRRWIG